VLEAKPMPVTRAYEEVIDFLAAGTSPQGIAEYRPSAKARARVAYLLAHEKTGGLTPDESSELQSYLQLEHIMRLAKARARQHLAPQ
jgi:hypothetical protein